MGGTELTGYIHLAIKHGNDGYELPAAAGEAAALPDIDAGPSRRLDFTLWEGRGLVDKDGSFGGKNDPYCLLEAGGVQIKSGVAEDAGSTPDWSQMLKMMLPSTFDAARDNLKISVFDSDQGADCLLGECFMSLAQILVPAGGEMEQWLQLRLSGQTAGEIRLTVKAAPDADGG